MEKSEDRQKASKGLVIGSFDPPHKGHKALVEYGAKHCDDLTVLVCATGEEEHIDGKLRYQWMEKMFADNPHIHVEYYDKPMPDKEYSSTEVSRVWANMLSQRYPTLDAIVSSETYGDYLSEFMTEMSTHEVKHMKFDQLRNNVPISSTLIRKKPLLYWDYLPKVVQPYFVKTICVYGPESTGKSELTKKLAAHFETNYVEEVASRIIDEKHLVLDKLTIDDLKEFAREHKKEVELKKTDANRVLICDTDNITTQVYADEYFQQIPKDITEHELRHDLYLLLDIDVPWVENHQRNLGHKRKEMFERFKQELDKRNANYIIIRGNWDERFTQAKEAVENIIEGNIIEGH